MHMDAFYYPYANISNEETLKKAVLYFDKINIINPWAYEGDVPPELMRLYEQKPRLIEFISPRKTFDQTYDRMVSESIIADLKDEKFLSYCKNQDLLNHFQSWELHRSKFPYKLMDYASRFPQIFL